VRVRDFRPNDVLFIGIRPNDAVPPFVSGQSALTRNLYPFDNYGNEMVVRHFWPPKKYKRLFLCGKVGCYLSVAVEKG
jgi:hypothetical protein